MTMAVKPLAEVNQQALQILYKELGVVNAVRFLMQFTTGFGNYVRERDTLFADKSLQEIIAEIQGPKERHTDTP
ncbi:MAG: hypothetical protein KatS3mg022_3068 [Armatimonadota bacterium]|nr:MAG: hypothetical protein KatS3mg022_3068 [Armatimonadota bacterium]